MSNSVVEFSSLEELQAWWIGRLKAAKMWAEGDMRSYLIRKLTPEMALWIYLEYNTRNRRFRRYWSRTLQRYIKDGKWKVHSQGMSMSDQQRLNNGQHRLDAIYNAGLPVDIYVTFNEPDGSFDALDSGTKRNVSDLGKQIGIADANRMSPAVKMLMALDDGRISTEGVVEPQDVIDYLVENSRLQGLDGIAFTISRKTAPGEGRRSRHSSILVALYLIEQANPEAAALFAEFSEKLSHGAGMNRGHPVLTLREGLIARAYHSKEKPAGAQGLLYTAAIINAWNKWLEGGSTTRPGTFTWDGDAFDTFPVPTQADLLVRRKAA